MSLISCRSLPTVLNIRWAVDLPQPVDLNPNATDIRITVPRSDDKFTDLYGAVLVITLSVINTEGSELDTDTTNIPIYQADHRDMLFPSGQLIINNKATEYIDSYGVLGYIRNACLLLGMMPGAKKTRLECKGWFEDKARGVDIGSNAAAEKERKMKVAGSKNSSCS